MSVIVVKGSNISSPIDAISLIGSDNGTQTVNVASPNITTSSANDLLIGFVKVSAGATFTSGTGFTQQPAASSTFLDAETGPAATAGTYNATFTLNTAQTWQSAVAAMDNNPNQALLSWTASTETGGTISQYLVERCQGSGCTSFVQIGTTTGTHLQRHGSDGIHELQLSRSGPGHVRHDRTIFKCREPDDSGSRAVASRQSDRNTNLGKPDQPFVDAVSGDGWNN